VTTKVNAIFLLPDRGVIGVIYVAAEKRLPI
jgi:hypothetical protein